MSTDTDDLNTTTKQDAQSPLYFIPGFGCETCAHPIRRMLEKQLQPAQYQVVGLIDGRLVIQLTKDAAKIVHKALQDSSYHLYRYDDVDHHPQSPEHLFKVGLATLFGLPMIIVGALGLTVPWLWLWIIINLILALTLLYVGHDTFSRALRRLWHLSAPGMDGMLTLSALLVVVISFIPGVGMMLDMGLILFATKHLSDYIREGLLSNVRQSLCLNTGMPQRVERQCDRKRWQTIDITAIKIGDEIRVNAGKIIPCNGMLLGNGMIGTKIINGKEAPQSYVADDTLLSGMRNLGNNPLILTVTQPCHRSHMQMQMLRLNAARKRQLQRSPINETIDNVISYFLPGMMLIAVILFICTGVFLGWLYATITTIGLLSSACPCTLPVMESWLTWVGKYRLAIAGIDVKDASDMQRALSTRVVVLDVNGTITTGQSCVSDTYIDPNAGQSADEIKTLVMALEAGSQHRIAKALRRHYGIQTDDVTDQWQAFTETHRAHNGISKKHHGLEYHIGNAGYMRSLGIDCHDQTPSRIFLYSSTSSVWGRVTHRLAYHDLQDEIVADAADTIRALQQRYEVVLCSGDTRNNINNIMGQAGIVIDDGNIITDCKDSPDKVTKIKAWQKSKNRTINDSQRKLTKDDIAMGGDGWNDTDAFRAFAFGIGILNDTDNNHRSIESCADVVLTTHRLRHIDNFFKFSQQTHTIIQYALITMLSYNILLIGLSIVLPLLFGPLAPCVMAITMLFEFLILFGFGLYLYYQPMPVDNPASKMNPPNNTEQSWGTYLSTLFSMTSNKQDFDTPLLDDDIESINDSYCCC